MAARTSPGKSGSASWRVETLTLICRSAAPGRCVLPAAQLCAGGLEDPAADRDDVPVGLGQRDEAVGRQAPARRVLPADQRLDAGDPLGLELDQRLVLEEQLVALQRQAELAAELHALHELLAHDRLEARHAALARVLGGVHREVGVPEHVVRGDVGTGALQAEARRRGDLAPVEDERRLERAAQALGDLPRLVGAREILEQDGELVAAEPRGGVLGAQAGRQSLGGRAQQLVADRVAEAVVDRLEVVEIDEDHRELTVVAPAARERQGQAILEQRPVGETGEVVVERLMAELLLERDALGDVAEVEQDPVDQGIADVVVRDQLERSIVAVGGAQAYAQRAGASASLRGLLQEARRADGVVGVDVVRQPAADQRPRGHSPARRAPTPRSSAYARCRRPRRRRRRSGGRARAVAPRSRRSAARACSATADRRWIRCIRHAEEAQQQQADRHRTEPPEPRALLRRARDAVLLAPREPAMASSKRRMAGANLRFAMRPPSAVSRREASSACIPWP